MRRRLAHVEGLTVRVAQTQADGRTGLSRGAMSGATEVGIEMSASKVALQAGEVAALQDGAIEAGGTKAIGD